MNLTQVETFLWIARLGSFRAAAQRLKATQPCISSRMQELESDLGVALFDRSSRRNTRLTAKGRAFIPHAERLLDVSAEIRQRFSAAQSPTGVVRLGVTGTIAINWLPRLLDKLAREAPGIEVQFVADLSTNLRQYLEDGKLDIAFFAGTALGEKFVSEILGRVPLVWLANPKLGIPAKIMTPHELASWPLISDVQQTTIQQLMSGWFAKVGVQPLHTHACPNLATRIQLAEAGLGIALIPLTALRDELETGRLRMVEVDPALPELEHLLVYRALDREEPVRRVIEIIKQQLTFEPNFRFSYVAAPQT